MNVKKWGKTIGRFLLSSGLGIGFLLSGGMAWTQEQTALPPNVILATEGKAVLSVKIPEKAGRQVKQAAEELCRILNEISGARFELVPVGKAEQAQGIYVGTAQALTSVWKELENGELPELDSQNPFRREEYHIETRSNGVWLIGATPLAVQHAVWDFLEGLGYRQYFPGELWEIIPSQPELTVARRETRTPDYHSRRIWFSTAKGWDHRLPAFQDWCRKNRIGEGFRLATGQAYQRILQSNRKVFEEHPDFYAEVKGERADRGTATKFNIANPELRKFVGEFALQFFEKHPNADSLSLEPSHGGGWCESPQSRAFGRATDQALFLANSVAEKIHEVYGEDKYIGLVAYHDHSQAPLKQEVHPNVIVSVATSFIRGGLTFDELVERWKEKGLNRWGVRDYFSVNAWDRDLPGRPLSSNLPQLAHKIAHYHQLGARFYSAQSGDNWGPNGLTHYIAAKMLWDVGEAEHYEEWLEDFLKHGFGPAEQPMRRFYREIHHLNGRPLLSEDLIGQLYRDLQEASRLAKEDPKVLSRIHRLVLYVRYVELYQDYANATGEERQQTFETLIRYAWSIRESSMIQTLDLYRDLVRRDKAVSIPKGAEWNGEETENPWKQASMPDTEQIQVMLEEGVKRNQLKGFEPREFSEQLIPAAKALQWEAGQYPALDESRLVLRGNRTFYVWADQAPAEFHFKATAGKLGAAGTRTELRLYAVTKKKEQPVDEVSFPNNQETHELVLKSESEGLHKVVIRDFGALTTLSWDSEMKVTLVETKETSTRQHGQTSHYFYVPVGTSVVGGFGGGQGQIFDSQGTQRLDFSKDIIGQGYFRIEVPEGEDGKLWTIRDHEGPRILLTVPSYFASAPESLLLPEEVVAADSQR